MFNCTQTNMQLNRSRGWSRKPGPKNKKRSPFMVRRENTAAHIHHERAFYIRIKMCSLHAIRQTGGIFSLVGTLSC